MCGIAGYIGYREVDSDRIRRCMDLMRRRGPDHAAYKGWEIGTGGHVVLIHSRLSIIDLDPRANQPFRSGHRWIVYNGELYNYLELRHALQREGHAFDTASDTEVLLRTIEAGGIGALDACEGMWAFALFDEHRETLTLGRDRFGEKPLYVLRGDDGIYFGSEVKFLTALSGRKLEVNLQQLFRYLVYGYRTIYKNDQTFFVGVDELLPARNLDLKLSNGGVCEEETTYWQPAFSPQDGMTYAEAVEGTRHLLFESVRKRLRADVPLAFCMSGGVDSVSLIGIAKKQFGHDVHGFTIVNSDSRYEETEMVDHAVNALGVRHTSVRLETDRFLERLGALVAYHDAPVYTISYYVHWMLMEQIARHGYRISVSGTAADELFTGYYDHHLAYLYQMRGNRGALEAAKQNWIEHVRPAVRNPFLQNPDLFFRDASFRSHLYLGVEEFGSYFHQFRPEAIGEAKFTDDLLRNRMLNEMFYESVPVILHEDDLNAMYYSIENRSPYLDRGLFEFANTIPTAHLVRDGYAKAVLRDAACGVAPEKVVRNRRKVGFNAPVLDLLDISDPAVRSCLLDGGPIYDWIRRDAIEALLSKPDLPNSQSKFVFSFLSSKLFLEEFAS